jgi:RNA polymerase-binding transcription factor DksA
MCDTVDLGKLGRFLFCQRTIMSRDEIEAFRRQLFEMGKQFKDKASDLKDEALRGLGGEASGNLSNLPMHLADLGSEVYQEDLALSLLEQTDQRLEQIETALACIDNGTYGTCETCRREIPRERLEAVPYARLCIDGARRAK